MMWRPRHSGLGETVGVARLALRRRHGAFGTMLCVQPPGGPLARQPTAPHHITQPQSCTG